MEGYRASQVGYLAKRNLGPASAAREDLRAKLERWRGPFEGAPGHTNAWGPERARGDIIDRAFQYVDANDIGHRFKIRNGREPEMPHYVLQRAVDFAGDDVIDVLLTQQGVRYVFADINPRGAAGGPGEGFDCSGLFIWGYAQVGFDGLPHQAEAIRLDSDTIEFRDESKCRQGDAVYMWFPNDRGISPGHASHIGAWVAKGRILDTRNPVTSPVAIRDIEYPNVVSYGRVVKVNGSL